MPSDISLDPKLPDAAPNLQARRYRSARTILALMLREMSTTYGRSPGGYIWAVLEPIGVITVLSICFSLVFRTPSLGTNFPMFFATGYLPFGLFQAMSNKIAISIRFSRPLLAYPAVTFTDAIIARFLLVMLTHIPVFVIVTWGIHVIFDLSLIMDYEAVILALVLAGALGLGVGTVNCYLMPAYPVWEQIWSIATRPLFLVSGVMFSYEAMPQLIRDILWYNPVLHVVSLMRRGFYASYDASFVSIVFVVGLTLFLLAFGMLLLTRHYRTLMNN